MNNEEKPIPPRPYISPHIIKEGSAINLVHFFVFAFLASCLIVYVTINL